MLWILAFPSTLYISMKTAEIFDKKYLDRCFLGRSFQICTSKRAEKLIGNRFLQFKRRKIDFPGKSPGRFSWGSPRDSPRTSRELLSEALMRKIFVDSVWTSSKICLSSRTAQNTPQSDEKPPLSPSLLMRPNTLTAREWRKNKNKPPVQASSPRYRAITSRSREP